MVVELLFSVLTTWLSESAQTKLPPPSKGKIEIMVKEIEDNQIFISKSRDTLEIDTTDVKLVELSGRSTYSDLTFVLIGDAPRSFKRLKDMPNTNLLRIAINEIEVLPSNADITETFHPFPPFGNEMNLMKITYFINAKKVTKNFKICHNYADDCGGLLKK